MATIKTKIWVSAGVFILSGVQAELPNNGSSMPKVGFTDAWAAAPHATPVNGEGGEGGEGGESGQKKLNAAERKIDFLKNLSLVEGHLIVGVELYRASAYDAAQSHMKHPSDELYLALKDGLNQYRTPGFSGSLKRLASAVEQKRPIAEVETAFRKVAVDIDAVRAKVQPTLKTRMFVISKVLHEAANEYAEGVKDGKVVTAHEYQDAYGFFTASGQLLAALKPTNAAHKSAIERARESLKGVEGAWPSLTSDKSGKTDASTLYVAASQIELAASSL